MPEESLNIVGDEATPVARMNKQMDRQIKELILQYTNNKEHVLMYARNLLTHQLQDIASFIQLPEELQTMLISKFENLMDDELWLSKGGCSLLSLNREMPVPIMFKRLCNMAATYILMDALEILPNRLAIASSPEVEDIDFTEPEMPEELSESLGLDDEDKKQHGPEGLTTTDFNALEPAKKKKKKVKKQGKKKVKRKATG